MIENFKFYRRPAPKTERPYRIRTLGKVENMPYHTTRGTYGADAMLMLFTSGKGRYHSETKVYDIQEGMLGLVLPKDEPGVLISDPDEPYTHIYCRFSGTEAIMAAKRIIKTNDYSAFTPCPIWRELHQTLQVMLTYHEFEKDYTLNANEPIRPEEGLLAHLLALLEYRNRSSKQRRVTGETLRRYILEHIAEPIDLELAAKRLGLSKPYLCRLARKELGDTLQRSMESAKIEWANTLLSNSDLSHLSIQEIAQHVGYVDALYFSKVFKRHHGVSPKAWRTAQKK